MKRTDIKDFLELSHKYPVVDVRSPSEFAAGHIPDAINIPLFNDEERAVVGTVYKKEGRIPAIKEGLRLTGKAIHLKLEKALEYAKEGKLLVHCWRGGMRSEAMAWLFSLGSIDCTVLSGGYKAYRNHILNSLSEKRNTIVLGGMTGSSKTHILQYLKEQGEQVIDLEGLAHHKGSAFGSLGQSPQPSTEQFANDLFREFAELDPGKPLWLEDESRNIGTVFMPDGFYFNMQRSKTIVLRMDIQTRLPRLLREYASFSPELLKASVMKISKRLGGDNVRNALESIDRGDLAKAITITLLYYDKAYEYSLKRKTEAGMIWVDTDTDDISLNAARVMEAAGFR
ncbi:MAG TPA: tRNA 2-selenouridine(34) synthase MnmH [Bacteroidales bacterium]|nr:tRNA 2-selenouridine(34) synthase MnmH [Bacteroidales bacterium]